MINTAPANLHRIPANCPCIKFPAIINSKPIMKYNTSDNRWWCLRYPLIKAQLPAHMDNTIVSTSSSLFSITSTPHKVNVVNIKGNTTQCMAQANDAPIPIASHPLFISSHIFSGILYACRLQHHWMQVWI